MKYQLNQQLKISLLLMDLNFSNFGLLLTMYVTVYLQLHMLFGCNALKLDCCLNKKFIKWCQSKNLSSIC